MKVKNQKEPTFNIQWGLCTATKHATLHIRMTDIMPDWMLTSRLLFQTSGLTFSTCLAMEKSLVATNVTQLRKCYFSSKIKDGALDERFLLHILRVILAFLEAMFVIKGH